MRLTPAEIPSDSARGRIEIYLGCLERWSARINLTGADTPVGAYDTLVKPILGAEALIFGHVLDVGSGNGSPGLILAALRPDLTFTLLEPRAKRWAFLREAVREMGLDRVDVRRERSDGYGGVRADTITMRAVGLNPESLRPLSVDGGQILIFGGPVLPGAEKKLLPAGSTVQRVCFT